MKKWWTLLAIAIVGALLYGCSGKENQSDANAPGQGSDDVKGTGGTKPKRSQQEATSVSLKDVIAAWESGDKDRAMAHFLSVKWDDARVFRDIRAFNISEQQLVSLPEDQRRPIIQQAMDVARSVRALAKHMTATAKTLAASGDVERAKAHCEAVMQCGRSWQAPEHLEVIKMVGKAMVTLTENKLSALK